MTTRKQRATPAQATVPRLRVETFFSPGGRAEVPAERRRALRRLARETLQEVARRILAPGPRALAVAVQVAGAVEIRALNRERRRIDRATDTLSFPQREPAALREFWRAAPPDCFAAPMRRKKPDGNEEFLAALPPGEPEPLGDIALCWSVIERQARRRREAPEEEFRMALIHAFLHLLGCDHDTPARGRSMRALTARLLKGAADERG